MAGSLSHDVILGLSLNNRFGESDVLGIDYFSSFYDIYTIHIILAVTDLPMITLDLILLPFPRSSITDIILLIQPLTPDSVQGGKQLGCSKCLRNYHLTCLNPPLYKPPRGDWQCSSCAKSSNSKRSDSQVLTPAVERKLIHFYCWGTCRVLALIFGICLDLPFRMSC